MVSLSVWSSAWPMCSEPVTFGGGRTMAKLGAFSFSWASGVK